MAQEFVINVVVNVNRAKRPLTDVERRLERIEKRADKLRRVMQRIFAVSALVVGVAVFAKFADTLTQLQNRLRTVVPNTQALTAATEELFQIARETRVGFQETVESFTRVSLAVKNLGIEQKNIIGFTKTLNQAIVLSGATATEANAGLIQLSQGLASGRLQGDELRSVLEQLPVVADVIAKQLKVTRGELREFGAQGKITSEAIITGFINAREEIEERFAKTIPTVAQSFTVLRNAVIKALGDISSRFKITETISKGILSLSDNIDILVKALTALGIVLTVVLVRVAIPAAIAAITALNVAIAANPIGALIIAITTLLSILFAFSEDIKVSADGLVSLKDLGVAAFQVIGEEINNLLEIILPVLDQIFTPLKEIFGVIQEAVVKLFDSLVNLIPDGLKEIEFSLLGFLKFFAKIFDTQVGIVRAVAKSFVDIFKGVLPVLAEVFTNIINDIIRLEEAAINLAIKGINEVRDLFSLDLISEVTLTKAKTDFEGSGKALGEALANNFNEALDFTLAEDLIDSIAVRARKRAEDARASTAAAAAPVGAGDTATTREPGISATVRLFLENLEKEGNLLKLNNREREIQSEILKLEEKLKRSLNDVERNAVDERLRINQSLQEQANLLEEIRGAEEELIITEQALLELRIRGAITAEEANRRLLEAQIGALEQQTDGISGLERGLLKLRLQLGDIATFAEDTLTTAFEGVSQALTDFVASGASDFKSLGDAIRNVANDIVNQLTKVIIQRNILAGFESIAGSVGQSGFFTDLFSGVFQNGGFIPSGQFGIVGEAGPEFVEGPARITSARETAEAMTGGFQIVNNFVIEGGTDQQTQEQIANSAELGLRRASRRSGAGGA